MDHDMVGGLSLKFACTPNLRIPNLWGRGSLTYIGSTVNPVQSLHPAVLPGTCTLMPKLAASRSRRSSSNASAVCHCLEYSHALAAELTQAALNEVSSFSISLRSSRADCHCDAASQQLIAAAKLKALDRTPWHFMECSKNNESSQAAPLSHAPIAALNAAASARQCRCILKKKLSAVSHGRPSLQLPISAL